MRDGLEFDAPKVFPFLSFANIFGPKQTKLANLILFVISAKQNKK